MMDTFKFTKEDYDKIAKVLGSDCCYKKDHYRFVLSEEEKGRKLSLEIYNQIPIGEKTGNLISIYTVNAHLQLHFCTANVDNNSSGLF